MDSATRLFNAWEEWSASSKRTQADAMQVWQVLQHVLGAQGEFGEAWEPTRFAFASMQRLVTKQLCSIEVGVLRGQFRQAGLPVKGFPRYDGKCTTCGNHPPMVRHFVCYTCKRDEK